MFSEPIPTCLDETYQPYFEKKGKPSSEKNNAALGSPYKALINQGRFRGNPAGRESGQFSPKDLFETSTYNLVNFRPIILGDQRRFLSIYKNRKLLDLQPSNMTHEETLVH